MDDTIRKLNRKLMKIDHELNKKEILINMVEMKKWLDFFFIIVN